MKQAEQENLKVKNKDGKIFVKLPDKAPGPIDTVVVAETRT